MGAEDFLRKIPVGPPGEPDEEITLVGVRVTDMPGRSDFLTRTCERCEKSMYVTPRGLAYLSGAKATHFLCLQCSTGTGGVLQRTPSARFGE